MTTPTATTFDILERLKMLAENSTPGDGFVLIKRGLYWKPDRQGYTAFLSEAGIYGEDESRALASAPEGYTPSTRRMPAAEAPEVAPGANDEHRSKYWQEKSEAQSATILVLVSELEALRAVRALTEDDIEAIIIRTETDIRASVNGDKIWTRRMAVALRARLSALLSENSHV